MNHVSSEPVGLRYYLQQKEAALSTNKAIIYVCNLGQVRSVGAAIAGIDRNENATYLQGGLMGFLRDQNMTHLNREGLFVILNDQKSIDTDHAIKYFVEMLELHQISYVITNTVNLMLEAQKLGQDVTQYFTL